MKANEGWKLRLAVLSTLIHRAPQTPGRTVLMKWAYLLQAVRGVPLGYRFELYNYGPYDTTLLSDLSQAVTLKAAKSETVYFSGGYGYEYTTNEKGHSALCEGAAVQLKQCEQDIEWVLGRFGQESASRLELITTVIFAEREMLSKSQRPARDELQRCVKRIKPYFADQTIADTVAELAEEGLITAH